MNFRISDFVAFSRAPFFSRPTTSPLRGLFMRLSFLGGLRYFYFTRNVALFAIPLRADVRSPTRPPTPLPRTHTLSHARRPRCRSLKTGREKKLWASPYNVLVSFFEFKFGNRPCRKFRTIKYRFSPDTIGILCLRCAAFKRGWFMVNTSPLARRASVTEFHRCKYSLIVFLRGYCRALITLNSTDFPIDWTQKSDEAHA